MKPLDEPHDHVVTLKLSGDMCVTRQHFEVEPEDVDKAYPFFCGGGLNSSCTITVEHIGRKVAVDQFPGDSLHRDWRFIS